MHGDGTFSTGFVALLLVLGWLAHSCQSCANFLGLDQLIP